MAVITGPQADDKIYPVGYQGAEPLFANVLPVGQQGHALQVEMFYCPGEQCFPFRLAGSANLAELFPVYRYCPGPDGHRACQHAQHHIMVLLLPPAPACPIWQQVGKMQPAQYFEDLFLHFQGESFAGTPGVKEAGEPPVMALRLDIGFAQGKAYIDF